MTTNSDLLLNPLSNQGFQDLARHQDLYCISLYLPQSYKSDKSFDDLVFQISRKIEINTKLHQNQGLTSSALKEHLNQIEPTIAQWSSNLKPENICIFISQENTQAFVLPIETNFRVYINDHFYLKPISQLYNTDSLVRLLYLERDRARLFNISHLEINRIAALKMKLEMEGPFLKANRSAFFKEVKKFQNIPFSESILKKVLCGEKNLIQEFLNYGNMHQEFDEELVFNPQKFHRLLLKKEVKTILNAAKKERSKIQLSLAHSDSSYKNIYDVSEILKYSAMGQIKSLFLQKNQDVYGAFDQENNFVIVQTQEQENTSLSNLAALNTINHQGEVFLMDDQQMPNLKNHMYAIINQ